MIFARISEHVQFKGMVWKAVGKLYSLSFCGVTDRWVPLIDKNKVKLGLDACGSRAATMGHQARKLVK